MESINVEPTGMNDVGTCPCCGKASRVVWGFSHEGERTRASYFVHWTLGHIHDYGASIDLIIGAWGEGATAHTRSAVSMTYRLTDTGPWLSVIDAATRPVAKNTLVGRALRRDEVIGTPLAAEAFAIADAVLLQDGRVAELRNP